jgi:hypothetical protein
MQNQIPFPVDQWSTDPSHAALLGQTFLWRGLKLLLVKAGAALTTPAGKFLTFSDRSNDGNTVAATADGGAYPGTVAGLVPATMSGSVTSNAYLFVIRGGKETDGSLYSVAIFSSAQVGTLGFPILPISSGVVGVHEISSTVQQGLSVGVLNQTASSNTWLTTPGTFSAEVQVMLD